MQRSREERRIASLLEGHLGMMNTYSERIEEAQKIENEDHRNERLAQINVFRRIQLDLLEKRLPVVRKIAQIEDEAIAADRAGKPSWQFASRLRVAKTWLRRLQVYNVSSPDLARLYEEELEKLKAA